LPKFFARRVLELSSKAANLLPAAFQGCLMRLAIDAITQAGGAAAAALKPIGEVIFGNRIRLDRVCV
jgi:hypothetical protein